MNKIVAFVEGVGRNEGEEYGRSHLYAVMDDGNYLPMCMYGWNRSDGGRLSIYRGGHGQRGLCKICQRRRDAGLPPVEAREGSHKTKWI